MLETLTAGGAFVLRLIVLFLLLFLLALVSWGSQLVWVNSVTELLPESGYDTISFGRRKNNNLENSIGQSNL